MSVDYQEKGCLLSLSSHATHSLSFLSSHEVKWWSIRESIPRYIMQKTYLSSQSIPSCSSQGHPNTQICIAKALGACRWGWKGRMGVPLSAATILKGNRMCCEYFFFYRPAGFNTFITFITVTSLLWLHKPRDFIYEYSHWVMYCQSLFSFHWQWNVGSKLYPYCILNNRLKLLSNGCLLNQEKKS